MTQQRYCSGQDQLTQEIAIIMKYANDSQADTFQLS